ncbi:synaptonemal complex protein 1-like protein [Lates japonicus]|uniref:Synaptonemal complex protein 1-like protein n=1 Tax=Lates japonicus TaxID=270547 RepID=A0AAD3M6F1_LATJO|nr:synaptonemal complex protein 1-like protein [Lates japonicus]
MQRIKQPSVLWLIETEREKRVPVPPDRSRRDSKEQATLYSQAMRPSSPASPRHPRPPVRWSSLVLSPPPYASFCCRAAGLWPVALRAPFLQPLSGLGAAFFSCSAWLFMAKLLAIEILQGGLGRLSRDYYRTSKGHCRVRSDIKRRKKRDLQQDYEELKVAHIINEEKFNAELQAHKDKIKALQDELKLYQEKCNTNLQTEEVQDEPNLSHEKLAAELKTEKENNEVLQNQPKLSEEKLASELKREKENNEVLQNQLKLSQEKLAAELKTEKENNEVLQNQPKLSEEKLAAELKTEKENHEVLQDTLKLGQDKLMSELHLEKQKNLALNHELSISQTRFAADLQLEKQDIEVKFAAELQQKQETVIGLKEELKTLVQKMKDEQDVLCAERAQVTVQLSTELQVEEKQQQPVEDENDLPQAEETETAPRKSTFKRFRHFLGLRKPQRWKRPAVPASTSGE